MTTQSTPRARSVLHPARGLRWQLFVLVLLSVFAKSSPAWAYSWMIRHGYTGCVTCHADPSGAGLLTPYGRAQSDLLLRTRYSGGAPEEADKSSGTAWGLVSPPDWLLLGGQFRGMGLLSKPDGHSWTHQVILMQADLAAQVSIGGVRASASAGAVQSSASRASVVGNFVSREHWLGYSLDDNAILIRAGRMNLPYGLRIIEHTMFVRNTTRTDINDAQQHGVAFAYSGDAMRAEMMGILGNYQISPDAYRERGYSAFVEVSPFERTAIGVSSLLTHAKADLYLQVPDTRQAHGIFARVSPWPALVLMAEGDLVVHAPANLPNQVGYASMLQADLEPLQGVHAMLAAESYKQQAGVETAWALWAGTNWFFAPHADVRLDLLRRSDVAGNARLDSTAILGQLHVFL